MPAVMRLVLVLLLSVILAAPGAWGQFPSGNAELLRGVVKVRHEGRERFYSTPGQRIRVYAGDVLHTGPRTRLVMTLRENHESFQMYSNSHLRVETVKPKLSLFGLNAGKALFSYLISRKYNNQFRVRTQSAVLGVKGTEFVVGSQAEKSYVVTLSGTVSLQRLDRPAEAPLDLRENEGVVLTVAAPTPAPLAISPELRERIIAQDGSPEEVRALEAAPPVERKQSGSLWRLWVLLWPFLPMLFP